MIKISTQNKKSIVSLIMQLYSSLLGIMAMVLIGNILDIDNFGLYYFVYSIIIILSIPTTLGLPVLVTRETTIALKAEDTGRLYAIWKFAFILIAISSLVIVVLGSLTMGVLDVPDPKVSAFLIGFVLIPIVALASLRSASLRGLGRVILSQLPEMILRPTVFIVILLGVFLLNTGQTDARAVLMIQALAALLAFIFGAFMLYRVAPPKASVVKDQLVRRRFLASAVTLGASGGLVVFNNNIDSAMLGFLRSDAEVGFYRPAATISHLVLFGFQAATWAIMPSIVAAHQKGNMEQLEKIAVKAARFGLSIAIFALVSILLFGEFFLVRFLGPEFDVSYIPLIVLTVGQTINAAFGALTMLLNMTGHERLTLRAAFLAVLVNIVLNAIFVPQYGVTAAAMATIVALLVNKTILIIAVKNKLNIKCTAFLV